VQIDYLTRVVGGQDARKSKKLSQGCFVEYTIAYLYEYIKLSQKCTKACYLDVWSSKSTLDYYECIQLSQSLSKRCFIEGNILFYIKLSKKGCL
jgi:hypothetical protein